jgi:hypothetical protein
VKTVANEIASRLAAIANCEKAGNTEWRDRHSDALRAIVRNCLPSGSGFDAGTSLDTERSTAEKLVFNTEFHHMHESGMYDGWTNHSVTVRASLLYGITLTISGRDRNGIKDYIHESFDIALRAPFVE